MLIFQAYDEGEAAATKEEVDLRLLRKRIVEDFLPVLNEKVTSGRIYWRGANDCYNEYMTYLDSNLAR